MNPCSLAFLIFVPVALLLFRSFSATRFRKTIFSAINLVFLAPLVPNWQSWVALGLFLGGSYLVLAAARREISDWLIALGSAIFIGIFLYLKKYVFLDALFPASLLNHPVEIVGLSYMLFKFLHMAVDQRQGQLLAFNFSSYLNYQLAFFTLIAGPIQRFNDYQKFWESTARHADGLRETLDAWNRILNGMLKMGVIATIALYAYERSATGITQQQPAPVLVANFITYFYAYPAYIYFNFSGYTDIMLGCGRLFGLKLPENFDRPYLARNVIDFWNRWHISLTRWIRDYVFMTSYTWVARRSARLAPAAAHALIFVSLFVAGVWHGSTLNFVIFGAIHGTGAVVTQLYGSLIKKKLKSAGSRRYNQNAWIRRVAMVLTFNFVCFSFLFFPADLPSTLDRLGVVADRLTELGR